MCEDQKNAIENFRNYNKEYINPVIRRWVNQGRSWNWIFIASYVLDPELSQQVEITPEIDKMVDEEVRLMGLSRRERLEALRGK